MSEINKTLVTAALVIIGNEVLSGRTQDANLKFLGTELNEIGIRMTGHRGPVCGPCKVGRSGEMECLPSHMW